MNPTLGDLIGNWLHEKPIENVKFSPGADIFYPRLYCSLCNDFGVNIYDDGVKFWYAGTSSSESDLDAADPDFFPKLRKRLIDGTCG